MKILRLCLALCSFTLFGTLKSQIVKSFNSDPAIFITELQAMYSGMQDKVALADFEKFSQSWIQGKFNPEQQRFLIRTSNVMLQEKLSLQPYFQLFYTIYLKAIDQKIPEDKLAQWRTLATKTLENSNLEFLSFLRSTELLFISKVLYKTDYRQWYFDSANFNLTWQKNMLAVVFDEFSLKCRSNSDSLKIVTKGIFFPSLGDFKGDYGKTDFSRILKNEQTEVSFKKYRINLADFTYSVDTVKLNFPRFFAKPIYGSFSDKLMNFSDTSSYKNAKFPKFSSFDNDLKVKGIVGENSVFTGGFSMAGNAITTNTVDGKPSYIDIFYKKKKQVTLKSKGFHIENGIASSPATEYILHLDSNKRIFHPSVNVKFIFKDNMLVAEKGTDGLMRGSFEDNFHNLSIDVQTVRWKITEPYVDFDNYNDEKPALFESNDFFREIYFDRWQGALDANPLVKIYGYYNRMPPDPVQDQLKKELKDLYSSKSPNKEIIAQKTKELQERAKNRAATFKSKDRLTFSLKDYCAAFGSSPDMAKHQFIDLHDAGFVKYDFATDSVTIQNKLFNYYLMSKKSKDYDVIRLSSVIATKPNATLNLTSNEFDIQGVRSFYFSDSQNVSVLPKDQQVVVTKNRNFRYSGLVRAGRFDFYGSNFNFNYSKFTVDFATIDSMRMYFPDESGVRLRPVKSVFRNIGGTLFIDKPNNKSGNINYPDYPIFTSNKGGDILYDKPSIHDGQYLAEKFKFSVDPFTIDSLDNFTIAGLRFEGTFYSADIFPVFKHYVYIQPDYSLGFVKPTPSGGLPMYLARGKGDMTLNLSEVGFYGEKGNIDYETSKTAFKRILLLPTKTIGPVTTYDLAENSKYPELHAVGATLKWTPYEDKYAITNGKTPIKTFSYTYDFEGTSTQSPSRVVGDGILTWDLAKFKSKEMVLAPKKATAEVGALDIYTADTSKMAFSTDNINGTMDFQKRRGDFTTNDPNQITRFPYNMYQTNLSDYLWKMDDKTIEARVGPKMAGIQPDFMSTKVTQDSLRFEGKKGLYDMKDYTLKVSQIPHIDLADSRLFLKDGKVLIRKEADMDAVDSTKLIANRIDKYHEIYKMNAKIFGKNLMRADGYYQYVNKMGARQEFYLDSIFIDRDYHVDAYGEIKEEKGFTLDTKIGFQGVANVKSQEQLIRFVGFVKPLHTFENVLPSWWSVFRGPIDPKDVVIPMNPPRDKNKSKLFVGLHVAKDSSHVYPLLYSNKRRVSDNDVTQDTGILYYDHEKQSFFAGSEGKLRNGEVKGNFIQFNEKDHSIHAEGPMDFGLETELIHFKNAGYADLKPGDTSFSFKLAMMIDFPLHPDFKTRMAELFAGDEDGTENLNTDFFKEQLGEMVENKKVYDGIINDIEKENAIKGNSTLLGGKDETNYNFILTDADFRWDSRLRGMYCNDNVILASVAGKPINKSITTSMFLESRRGSEKMHLYFSNGQATVYFFLTRNRLSIYSDDEQLKTIMDKTNHKVKGDNFQVILSSERSMDKFLRKIDIN
jgi:hypothetical protein